MTGPHTGKRAHWESIYEEKPLESHGWYQPVPLHSLHLIEQCGLQPEMSIIDIGGGDSLLVDHLLDKGFHNITVLDISASALERARIRLGEKAGLVDWVQCDVTTFSPSHKFHVWHDRAAFHFLLEPGDIQAYMQVLRSCIEPGGYVILGTFSEMGPKTCSGLPIKQYNPRTMSALFSPDFDVIDLEYADHFTPSGSRQHYIFGRFRKK